MIRRSTVIAVVAILVSLLIHFVGLAVTTRIQPERAVKDAAQDVVAMGNAFEDVAEPLPEPEAPEPAVVPPVEPLPEPEAAIPPTSEALVASDNPQDVVTPDTGSAQTVQPAMSAPPAPSQGQVPAPETVEPSGGAETATPVPPANTPPATPDVAPPVTTPAVAPAAIPETPQPAAPAQSAALAVTPSIPVTPAPSVIPVVPATPDSIAPEPVALEPVAPETVEPEPAESEIAETTIEPVPEVSESQSGGSELAVASSLRPQLPDSRPPAQATAEQTEVAGLGESDLAPTQRLESPLTVYRRDGIDLFAGQSGTTQSGGLDLFETRGAGNSSVTNYVGEVLVHLNRAAAVRVSAQGYARVFFEINPDGSLAWVDVIESTGSEEIERAAKSQVRSAAPFPPPPDGKSRKLGFVYRSD